MQLVSATAWPADAGIDIHANLPAGYEPSGIVWHPHYNALFLVSDGGLLSKMNLDGTNVTTWNIGGDLEGVTITDANSDFVYIAVEHPFAVIRFNPLTRQNQTISLTGVIPEVVNTNSGIEAITFIPNGFHPYANSTSGGLFYVGVQENGVIYAVDLDFNTGTARLVNSITPVAGRGDIAGLNFNPQTKVLSVLYDSADLLREITTSNVLVNEYTVPGFDQEGVTIIQSCPNARTTLVIAEDSGRVMKYGNYPLNCPPAPVDNDHDGFTTSNDCNDNNALVNPGRSEVLYNGLDDDCNPLTPDTIDADSDGFNSNVDCNDNNALVNPGRIEVVGNGLDDDCNAATSDVAPVIKTVIEGENMTTINGGAVRRLADSVAFYTTGYAQQSVNLTNATYNITILARADVVPNHNANLRVTIDGTVIGNYVISSPTFVPVTFNRNLNTGSHTIKVQFTNDYYVANPRQDVNLYVDKITLTR